MTRPLWPGDPRNLGRYELLGRLGEGGMGSVYLGRGPDGRQVAVKVIRAEHAWDAEFRGRFRSEVNRARQVPPFCTAAVLDADPDHETPYLVVEYVDGPSLSEVIKEQGPLSEGTLHSVAIGVATALSAIHGAGVVHRDLKPQNVLFSLGTPKVIDFGIARAVESNTRFTATDQMVGTVAYMAPERFEAGSDAVADPASDVFAWGAVVAYAATGHTPFGGDSAAATAGRILTQPPNLAGLSGPLRNLVDQTLAKDPRARPTAQQVLQALLDTGPAGPPELRKAAEAAVHVKPDRIAGGRRSRWGLVAGIAALLVAGGMFLPVARDALAGSSASPSEPASPSAPAPTTATTRIVSGPQIIDALDRPGQWKTTKDDNGSCLFQDKRMVVTPGQSAIYQCTGATSTFGGDQILDVDVTLLKPGSCAVIWFRLIDPTTGYAARFCDDVIGAYLENDGQSVNEHTVSSHPIRLNETHRAGVHIVDGTATITLDQATMLTLPLTDPALAGGQISLGALDEHSTGDTKIAFAKLAINPN